MNRKNGMQPAAPAITCSRLSISYGHADVLTDVSLEIPKGLFLPVIGPNGAGKTTLLRAFAGLVQPASGRLTLHISQRPGYVPQAREIDPLFPVSAFQLAAMGLYSELGPWGLIRKGQKRRLDELFERFALSDHRDKNISLLSGGMVQKVLLIRALAVKREMLLLDEPAAALDASSEKTLMRFLKELSEEKGVTIVMVHHGLAWSSLKWEKICVVEHGRAGIYRAGDTGGACFSPSSWQKEHEKT